MASSFLRMTVEILVLVIIWAITIPLLILLWNRRRHHFFKIRSPLTIIISGSYSLLLISGVIIQDIVIINGFPFPCSIWLAISSVYFALYTPSLNLQLWRLVIWSLPEERDEHAHVLKRRFAFIQYIYGAVICIAIAVGLGLSFDVYRKEVGGRQCAPFLEVYVFWPLIVLTMLNTRSLFKQLRHSTDVYNIQPQMAPNFLLLPAIGAIYFILEILSSVDILDRPHLESSGLPFGYILVVQQCIYLYYALFCSHNEWYKRANDFMNNTGSFEFSNFNENSMEEVLAAMEGMPMIHVNIETNPAAMIPSYCVEMILLDDLPNESQIKLLMDSNQNQNALVQNSLFVNAMPNAPSQWTFTRVLRDSVSHMFRLHFYYPFLDVVTHVLSFRFFYVSYLDYAAFFAQFAKKALCYDNLLFWDASVQLRKIFARNSRTDLLEQIDLMINSFIRKNSIYEIDISLKLRTNIIDLYERAVSPQLLDEHAMPEANATVWPSSAESDTGTSGINIAEVSSNTLKTSHSMQSIKDQGDGNFPLLHGGIIPSESMPSQNGKSQNNIVNMGQKKASKDETINADDQLPDINTAFANSSINELEIEHASNADVIMLVDLLFDAQREIMLLMRANFWVPFRNSDFFQHALNAIDECQE